MTDWQRKLQLQPEWDQAAEHEITIQQLAGVIADRLRVLAPFTDEFEDIDDQRQELADQFESMSQDETLTTSQFDYLMNDLYDWGDTQIGGKFFDAKKVCWINRF